MTYSLSAQSQADKRVAGSPAADCIHFAMSSDALLTVQDYEEKALKILDKRAADYYRSGSDQQCTLSRNRSAFDQFLIRPRFLMRDVSKRDLSTTFLTQPVSMPIAVAPTAMQKMAHPDGELATAKACQASGTVMILSTISTSSIEEVAAAAPSATKWFQLYIYKDRTVTRSLISRAEKAGFRALVLTVDTPFFGTRHADVRNKFCLPPHLTLANLSSERLPQMTAPGSQASGLNEYATSLFDPSLTWKDVQWLKSITRLPIIVKGILTAEDATIAADSGVSGIIVSNHGARQLDHVSATIHALSEVVKAVNGRCEVFIDGGFRTGTDVFKALAMGARGVFVGRPIIWGLAVGGETGAQDVLKILRNEFDNCLALSGCSRLSDIRPDHVVHSSYYSKL